MKIAILSFYTGINLRGTEIWADELRINLPKNFEIDVISGRKGETIVTNVINNISRIFSSDIIVPTGGRVQAFLVRMLSWVYRKPMVIFGHSGLGADDKWNLLCSPNVFVAFSTYQEEWAEKFKLPWTKIVMIPHAVNTNQFTPTKKIPEEKIVLCVAANTPEKRIGLVKSAVRLVSGARFMAVGKGNPTRVEYSQMPGIYRKARVFCFVPNSWEAFGLVFLEAMSSNLPVVTTNDRIRREIVGEAGIFVDHPENPEELALAIDATLSKDWGERPRKQAEKFSWNKIIPKYRKLFSGLMK